MVKVPTLLEMLKNGVHFGHQSSRWHPKMEPYIFGVRNGIHIIDLQKTSDCLENAMKYVGQISGNGGKILFVGTKRQGSQLIKKYAEECGMPYVDSRWLGGLLTNFSVLHQLIRKYKDLVAKRDSGKLSKYTKKEQLKFSREIEKLESMVGGISNLDKIPDAVFILDLKREKTAFTEALKKNVKVIAFCDTNVNPTGVDYPIPANDDATKSIEFIIQLISKTVQNGKKNQIQNDLKGEKKDNDSPSK